MSRIFDATTTNFLSVASAPTWPADSTGNGISFAAYIKPDTTGQSAGIIGMFTSTATNQSRMLLDLIAGDASYFIEGIASIQRATYTATAISASAWTPIVGVLGMVSGAADNSYIYVGSAANVATLSGAMAKGSNTPDVVNIGRFGDSTPGSPYDGLVSNAVIWSKALSGAEITAFFAATSQADIEAIADTDMWGYWPLDTANGLNDVSGNARNLTVNGTVALSTDEPFSAATDPTPPYVSVSIS